MNSPGSTTLWDGSSGLTMIELIVVIFILGIIFSLSAVSVNALAPVYRVRSASRNLGARIEEIRGIAINRGRPMGIRYSMGLGEDPSFYQLIPPAPDEYPDEPIENRQLGVKNVLPTGVRFRQIAFSSGRAVKAPGVVIILFSPMGNTGSHVVTLEGTGKDGNPIVLSVKFNAVTGLIDFYEGETEFQHHEG